MGKILKFKLKNKKKKDNSNIIYLSNYINKKVSNFVENKVIYLPKDQTVRIKENILYFPQNK